jgi:hypothetical protein
MRLDGRVVVALAACVGCGRTELDDPVRIAARPDARPSTADGGLRALDARAEAAPDSRFCAPMPAGSGFVVGQVLPTRAAPNTLVVGDFNGDGRPDMVVVDGNSPVQDVFVGTGGGIFAPSPGLDTGEGETFVAAGDVNGDGFLDLVVAAERSVSVWEGGDNATFRQLAAFLGEVAPGALVMADVNRDHKLDLVLTDIAEAEAVVMRGDGRGGFDVPRLVDTGGGPVALAVADLDGDGKPDLVALGPGEQVAVLLGSGDGTFGPGRQFQVPGTPGAMATADFDRDGNLDVAVAMCGSGDVAVLTGDGRGDFHTPVRVRAGASDCLLAAADLNGDGLPDLVVPVLDLEMGGVLIWLGDGRGGFSRGPRVAPAGAVDAIYAVDLDGDGHSDLALIDREANRLTTLLWRGPNGCP